ncbi:MAG: M50 family metallopeptidase [Myxococcota bacterium]|nr:M50 family metallopeptidase [Myxococcota bacterium]
MFVLAALLSLGVALWVHEAGHVLAARVAGLRVHRLVFGLGPRLLTRWPGGMELVIRALPLWAESAVEVEPPGAPVRSLRRALVLLCGPLVSLGFGLSVLTGLHLAGTHVVVPLTVGQIQPGSEAARAQLLPGDRVEAVNGAKVANWRELTEQIEEGTGTPLALSVRRGEELREVSLIPRPDAEGSGRIGISQQYVFRRLPLGEAVESSALHAWSVVRDVVVGALTPRRFSPRQLGTGWGLDRWLRALASVSVVLGALHLVPLPPLDTGAALLALWERRRGAPYSPTQRAAIQLLGFLLLAALAVVAALFRAGSL